MLYAFKKHFFVLFLLFFVFVQSASADCVIKTDYDPAISCSNKLFVAKSQADLDSYATDFGLQGGKYRGLEINFNLEAATVEIHSPCNIKPPQNKSIMATTLICLDAREGFIESNGTELNAPEVTLLSENGGASFKNNFEVHADNFKVDVNGSVDIKNNVSIDVQHIVEIITRDNSANISIGNNANIGADFVTIDTAGEANVGSNAVFSATSQFDLDASVCSISNATINSPLITGTCFNNQNDAPVMVGDQIIEGDGLNTITFTLLGATDADGGNLTYEIVTPLSSGTLSNCLNGTNDLTCTFTPEQTPVSEAVFTYKASDGILDSVNVSTVTIKLNTAPVMGLDQVVSTNEDEELFITLNPAIDAEGDALTYTLVTSPTLGTLSECLQGTNDLTCRYVPNANVNGQDTFTFKANDGTVDSETVATVTVHILPVSDAPTMGANQTFSTNEDQELLITLNPGFDIDGDPLTYQVVNNPTLGTVVDCLGGTADLTCRYIPNPNVIGTDTFTFKANDGALDAPVPATVTINILPVNDPPVVGGDQSISTQEDMEVSFNLLPGSDIDGDSLIYTVVTSPNSGTLLGCLGGTASLSCTYTPNADFNGQDFFTYKVNDGNLDSTTVATVTITIDPVNDPPVVGSNQTFNVTEDTPFSFTVNTGSDIDGDALTYTVIDFSDDDRAGVVSDCLQGTDDLTCIYTPSENTTGTFSFEYVVNDGELNSETVGIITFAISGENDAPQMVEDQTFETNRDQLLSFTLRGAIDIDADPNISYRIVSNPTLGVVSNCLANNNDLTCDYTPNPGVTGTDTFTYIANDGQVDANSVSTVTINIIFNNNIPVMSEVEIFQTNEDTPFSFTVIGGSDADGDTLAYSIIDQPENGVLTNCLLNNNDLECDYAPNPNFAGQDSFSYIASDGQANSLDFGQVIINVLPINDPPVMVSDQNFQTNEDQVLSLVLSGASDIDGGALKYSIVTAPANGTVTDCLVGTGDLECLYTPNASFSGVDTFTYIANDGFIDASQVSKVTITVVGQNDAPVPGENQNLQTPEDQVLSFNLNPGSDPEGDNLTYNLVGSVIGGSITGCLDSTSSLACTFTPDLNFNGQVIVSYSVSDGSLTSAFNGTITIDVIPVDDPPVMLGDQSFNLSFLQEGVKKVTTGFRHSCALLENGRVKCWGFNFFGQLGYGDTTNRTVPLNLDYIELGGRAIDLFSGRNRNCVILENGNLRCWGDNANGMLGIGSTENIGDNELPTASPELSFGERIAQVAMGDMHNCVVTELGKVACWGQQTVGELGYAIPGSLQIGDDEQANSLGFVDLGAEAKKVTVGNEFTCSLLINGDVKCWGTNGNGGLGVGDRLARYGDDEHPSQAPITPFGEEVLDISSGTLHSCALLANGRVKCWGSASQGILGYGNGNTIGDDETPFDISPVDTGEIAVAVLAAESRSCIITDQLNSKCWGSNFSGALGQATTVTIGDNEAPSAFNTIPVGASVTQIDTGFAHTCALLDSKNVKCWGNRNFGELGQVTSSNIGDNEFPDTIPEVVVDPITGGNNFTLLGATDVDGPSPIYEIVDAPNFITLNGCLGNTASLNCEYTINPVFFGDDVFTYRAIGSETVSTVTLTVLRDNNVPVMSGDQSFSVKSEELLNFRVLGATDADGNSLTYEIVTAPASGTLSGCDLNQGELNCQYRSNVGFIGTDFFTYKANDGTDDSDQVARVTINVVKNNIVPVMGENQIFTTNENESISITLNQATDANGDSLVYRLNSLLADGALSDCLGNTSDLSCLFTPNNGFSGEIVFSYVANDGDADATQPATVTITVNPVNDAPVMGMDQSFQVPEDTSINFDLMSATDADGDELTYRIVSAPTLGTLTNCLNSSGDLSCTYIPNPSIGGVDSFTYIANDGTTDSATVATVTITILGQNDLPIMAADIDLEMFADEPLNFTLPEAFDPDGDPLTYEIWRGNIDGTLTGCADGTGSLNCTYEGPTELLGTAYRIGDFRFRYIARDAVGEAQTFATVRIKVKAPVRNVVDIRAGSGSSSCRLNDRGELKCWGFNTQGQLGQGNNLIYGNQPASVPALIKPIQFGEEIVQVEGSFVGGLSSSWCAISSSNNLYCWGDGAAGKLGYGNTENVGDNERPIDVGPVNISNNIKSISLGTFHMCAVFLDNKMKCWGSNFDGELGYADMETRGDDETPADIGFVDVGGDVQSVAAGNRFTCALLTNGDVKCWGWRFSLALGQPVTENIGDDEHPSSIAPINLGAPAIQISAGTSHACALLVNNKVICWGRGNDGKLGYGNINDIGDNETPASAGFVDVGEDVQAISVANGHSCALTITGKVVCWGSGSNGQLGYGNVDTIGDDEVPASAGFVNIGFPVSRISSTNGHNCALGTQNETICWGFGGSGRLGYGNTLTIGDNEDPASIGTNNPTSPTSLFTFSPIDGRAPISVTFDGSGSTTNAIGATITNYTWFFPDGTQANGQIVNKTFNSQVNGQVRLLVTDSNGITGSSGQVLTVLPESFPTTTFTISETSGRAPLETVFDASGSTPSVEGTSIVSYSWSFGDGTTGTGVSVTKTYSQPGVYTIRLSVEDDTGKTSESLQVISVLETFSPVAVIQGTPQSGFVPLTVFFNGTSSSGGGNETITSYEWDWGDGSMDTGMVVNHTYTQVGIFRVLLTVTNTAGKTSIAERFVTVTPRPNAFALIETSKDTVEVGESLDFDGSGSNPSQSGNNIASYAWEWGDGNNATGVNPSHAFNSVGIFEVTLTVTDDQGFTGIATKQIEVVPQNVPPVADFTFNDLSTEDSYLVDFDASLSTDADGMISSYFWDWGDGTQSTGRNLSHVYTNPGTYTVRLTVVDNGGASNFIEKNFRINSPSVVAFTTDVTEGEVPLTVNFDASSSVDPDGSIVSYEWTFGDSNTGTGETTSHTFNSVGEFTTVLKVTDNEGFVREVSRVIKVLPVNILPVAAFTFNINEGLGEVTIDFNASSSSDSDGNIVAIDWQFPDGSTASGLTVSKTFTQTFTNPVVLTVTDDRGGVSQRSQVLEYFIAKPIILVEQLSVALFEQEIVTLRSEVRNRNGDLATPSNLSWSSSDESILTVDNNGRIVAISAGTATITISHPSGAQETQNIEVRAAGPQTITNQLASSFFTRPRSNIKVVVPVGSFGELIFSELSNSSARSNPFTGIASLPMTFLGGTNTIDIKSLSNSFPTVETNVRFFDGVNDSLRFENDQLANLKLNNDFTQGSFAIGVWIRNSALNSGKIVSIPTLSGGEHGLEFVDNSTALFKLNTDNGVFSVGSLALDQSEWVRLIISYDSVSKELKLYENTRLVNSIDVAGTIDGIDLSQPVILGGNFKGHLDELRIWNRNLSIAEINAELFESAASAPSTNAQAFFSFDKVHGQILKDELGGSDTITLGETSAYDDKDPTLKKKSQFLVQETIDHTRFNQIKFGDVKLELDENTFILDANISIGTESVNTDYRLPEEFDSFGFIYKLRGRFAFSGGPGKLTIPINANVNQEDIVVLKSTFTGVVTIINESAIEFNNNLISFPVNEFADYWLAKKNDFTPTINFISPLFSETVFTGGFSRSLTADGSFGSSVMVEGDMSGETEVRSIICNGTWLTNVSSDFPFDLPLNQGTNNCSVFFRSDLDSNINFYLSTQYGLRIFNN